MHLLRQNWAHNARGLPGKIERSLQTLDEQRMRGTAKYALTRGLNASIIYLDPRPSPSSPHTRDLSTMRNVKDGEGLLVPSRYAAVALLADFLRVDRW